MRWIPPILQRRGTDEYVAPAHTARDRRALAHFADAAPTEARRLRLSLPRYAAARVGTAAHPAVLEVRHLLSGRGAAGPFAGSFSSPDRVVA